MKVSHCFKPDLDIYPNKTIVTKLFEAQTRPMLHTFTLTIIHRESDLDGAAVLHHVDLELGVEVGEVDQHERVGAGLAQQPLQDAVHHYCDVVVAEAALQLAGLFSVLRHLGGGEGGGGRQEGAHGGQPGGHGEGRSAPKIEYLHFDIDTESIKYRCQYYGTHSGALLAGQVRMVRGRGC